MNDIQTFNFQNNNIRIVMDDNGEPWFVAKDVAEILGYASPDKMYVRLDDDEKTTTPFRRNGSNYQTNLTLINESGLYNAIIGSNKPEAKAFKKWVTSEVLPSIRKTGSYFQSATGLPSSDVLMSTLYAEMEWRIKAEAEPDGYKRNLARIARASNLTFGEISAVTGLPKDIVVAAHCKSCRKSHKPQLPKYIQLVLPMREILEECRAIGTI